MPSGRGLAAHAAIDALGHESHAARFGSSAPFWGSFDEIATPDLKFCVSLNSIFLINIMNRSFVLYPRHSYSNVAIDALIKKIPTFIHRAISSYEKICSHDAWEGSRSYGAHHVACQAALSHLDILLRIESGLRTTYAPTDWTSTTDIESLLGRANAEIEGSGNSTSPKPPHQTQ
jgi:hypothetical protein